MLSWGPTAYNNAGVINFGYSSVHNKIIGYGSQDNGYGQNVVAAEGKFTIYNSTIS
jgi:hypothetical protein